MQAGKISGPTCGPALLYLLRLRRPGEDPSISLAVLGPGAILRRASVTGILALFSQLEEALEFLPRPGGGQLPALLGGVIRDLPPGPGGPGQLSFPFEQERAGVDRAEILGVELMMAAPVGEGAFHVAGVGLDLAAVVDQARVVLGDRGRRR